MKINYDELMNKEIETFKEKKKLLLHSCCAPCSSAVISRLRDDFDITVLYYNPNIEPLEEYEKRKEEQIRFLKEFDENIKFMDILYDHESFIKISKNLEMEKEGGARCHKCYHLRLNKTASLAKKYGFDYFGTTLTVSPYKNSQVINEIGLFIEKNLNDENIHYLVSDFKKKNGYKKSIELSHQYNLYRQNFCGCSFSKINKDS